MNANKTHCMAALPKSLRRIALVLAALTLAVVLAFAGSLQDSSQAYANIYPASEASAAVDQASGQAASADGQASGQAAATDGQENSEGETIEDDENPMSSGLGGGEPLSSSSNGIKWIIIAGIAAVVVFFVASTLRLNKNISTMRNRFKR